MQMRHSTILPPCLAHAGQRVLAPWSCSPGCFGLGKPQLRFLAGEERNGNVLATSCCFLIISCKKGLDRK